LVVACGVAAAAEEQVPKFTFNPGNGTVRTMRGTRTTETRLADGRSRSTTVTSVFKESYARTEPGYTVRQTLISSTLPAGLEAVMNALRHTPLVYEVDAAGKLLSVKGPEAIIAELQAELPRKLRESMPAAYLDAEQMREQQRVAWKEVVTDAVGRPAGIGEAWVATTQLRLPDGRVLQHYAARKVVGRAMAQGRPCVRVQIVTSNDPEELRGFLGTAADTLLNGLKPLSTDAKISGSGHAIMDPATALQYDSGWHQRVEAEVKYPEVGLARAVIAQTEENKVTVQMGK
jgi:hypothetical protein